MIEIHLYGKLRRYAPKSCAAADSVITLETSAPQTLAHLLRLSGIPQEEVTQVFLNGQLLTTSFSMAPYLDNITAQERLPTSESPWEPMIRDGDRLGLFPPRMSRLGV